MTTTIKIGKRLPHLSTAILLAPCLAPCLAMVAWAQSQAPEAIVPRNVNYSGTAKDVDGKPLTGAVGVTFAVYAEQTGGAPLWMENQNVAVGSNGKFSAVLGATQSAGLPLEVFNSGQGRWLGVSYNGGTEQPRVALLSVPYALKAGDAQTIGGLPPSAFVLAVPVGAGTAVSSNAPGNFKAAAVTPDAGSNVTTTGGNVNTLPLWTTATNIQSSAITQTGSGASAKIGIGTSTPAAALDVKGGATVRGPLTLPAAGTATAAAGTVSQPQKLVASAFSSSSSKAVPQTFEWQAEPAGNNTANPSGTLDLLFGSGTAAPAETGLKISNHGMLTFASGQSFPGTGTITGVTAGTDLTGGGASGNVTLSLDTSATDARYARLGAANTFTGNQTVTGGLTSSGTVQGAQGFFANSTGAAPLEAIENDTTRVDNAVAGIIYSGQSGSAAVVGTALARVGQIFGVEGTAQSPEGFGVYGADGARSAIGNADAGEGGVWGDAGAIGFIGVQATADDGFGLAAINNSQFAQAVSATNTSTQGQSIAVYGFSYSPTGSGLVGEANISSGIYSSNQGSFPAGVTGDTGVGGGVGVWGTADQGYAVYGVNNGSYVSGLFINQSSSLSYGLEAGSLNRNCTIDTAGDLDCSGTEAAVVSLPDQRQVQVFTIHSTENWFEDFGAGQLAGGKAVITLDQTFAQTVNSAAGYHVFLTPNGDSRGLYVTAKSPTSFEVHEQGGGTSNVSFDYRIVAKRNGYEDARLTDVTSSRNQLLAKARAVTQAGPRHGAIQRPAFRPVTAQTK